MHGPLLVFGRRGDPKNVALVVARAVPGGQLKKSGQKYRVTVAGRKGLLRHEPELVVEVDPTGFEEEWDGRAQQAVREALVRSIRGPGLDDVLAMIPELRISITFRPSDADRLRRNDPLALFALDMAARVDGFVLDIHNGQLRSTTGEVLGSTELFEIEGGTPLDPSFARIKARLVALLAVAARALTEYDGRDLDEARRGIAQWVRSVALGSELEPHETAFLDRPAGQLSEAELAHASWQLEGAAVLAWALELLDELPPHDQAVDPTLLSGLLCFPDATKTQAVLKLGRRRFHGSVEAEAERHGAIFDQLRAIEASGSQADDVDVALRITAERLRAFQWLMAGGSYSTTDQ